MRSFSAQSPEAPTPFLDALTASPQAAYWPRYYTNGVPTAYAMLALDTSVPPHSSEQVSTNFTGTRLDGFAGLLRTAGYRTLFYTAADPDWDNQRYWLRRWFDRIDYDPANRGHDRPVFRHAAQDLLRLDANRPFFAIVQSMSNHPPFRSPEPRFARSADQDALHRINATMRYTDDVIREFYATISRAPWFANTILVVTGDHGLDIGDRGESGGLTNLRHETSWVPLIMARPAGLPVHGAQPVIGSHVDLGPTFLDLAGLCPDMAATGHSLLAVRPEQASAFSMKNGSIALETHDYSLFLPVDGGAMLYDGADRLQQRDIAAGHPAIVQALTARARTLARLNDALLDSNHVRPR
jgi:phosphoglycerol transferase MdoB-like AlkP superfamily enzyme